MTDRSILFSPEMVRAILAGRKTQTRRVLRRPTWAQEKGWPDLVMNEQELDGTLVWYHRSTACVPKLPIPQPGDRLYVREAWKSDRYYDDLSPSQMSGEEPLIYLADDTVQRWGWKPDALSCWGRFRQGMHMPKWASRITLHVTDVRVERVQEISDRDALAEGVKPDARRIGMLQRLGSSPEQNEAMTRQTARWVFADLWNTLNAPRGYGWDVNPWVSVTTFEPEFCNISEARG